MQIKSINIYSGYAGGEPKIEGKLDNLKRVIIFDPEKILKDAINERGFNLSREGRERIDRVKISTGALKNTASIDIPLSQNDLEELLHEGKEFHWNFKGIDVHIFKEN